MTLGSRQCIWLVMESASPSDEVFLQSEAGLMSRSCFSEMHNGRPTSETVSPSHKRRSFSSPIEASAIPQDPAPPNFFFPRGSRVGDWTGCCTRLRCAASSYAPHPIFSCVGCISMKPFATKPTPQKGRPFSWRVYKHHDLTYAVCFSPSILESRSADHCQT